MMHRLEILCVNCFIFIPPYGVWGITKFTAFLFLSCLVMVFSAGTSPINAKFSIEVLPICQAGF